MSNPASSQARPLGWCALALLLLAWNGVAGMHAHPMLMTQVYDGTQYHLLARNRLQGHTELGEQAHTVRQEGQHPIWRPGMVWLVHGLTCCTGSIREAAGLA